MEKILLPTDFSENSKNAIRFAIKLFAFSESYHILLHSYDVPAGSSTMLVSVKDIMKKESLIELEKMKNELESEFHPYILDLDYITEYGDVGSAVNTVADYCNADIVVMGTKGASGLRELIMGSNTYSVIKNTSKPVLAVPENASLKAMKRVLLVSDFSKVQDKSIFKILNLLLKQYNGMLYVVHVKASSEEQEKAGKDELAKQVHPGAKVEFVEITGDDVVTAIKKYVDQNPPDLLCVVAQKRSYFESIFHKSVTKTLAMNPVTPLLVLKDYEG